MSVSITNQYFVKAIDGKTYTFQMTPDTHVSELKLRVFKKTAPDEYEKTRKYPDSLRLIYSGRELKDRYTLEENNFIENATAHALYAAYGD